MTKGMIYVEPERCMACKSCELACAVAHSRSKDLIEAMREEPRPVSRVDVVESAGLVVPLHCRHCDGAPCVQVCPTGAIVKTELGGPVIVRGELCVGCRSCTLVCPYGVPQLSPEGRTIVKCDLCFERLEAGQVPACVEACPTGALKFKRLEEVERETASRGWMGLLEGFARRAEGGEAEGR